jgi:hypothetical protein
MEQVLFNLSNKVLIVVIRDWKVVNGKKIIDSRFNELVLQGYSAPYSATSIYIYSDYNTLGTLATEIIWSLELDINLKVNSLC